MQYLEKTINMTIKIPKREKLSREQLREHYEIEKELADKLRNATKEQRRHLYTSLYDELFRRVPLHPQLTRKTNPTFQRLLVAWTMRLLKRFLNSDSVFLEVGAGDCSLSIEVAKNAKKVYAVDVSKEITKDQIFPQNCEFIISDGTSIPVPKNSINLVYSNQLMEHLHPADALEQLQVIYEAMTPGGAYICITPNRINGPHDVSRYFDRVATGFHLKEYTVAELSKLFHKVGFSRISSYIGARGIYLRFPISLVKLAETVLMVLPWWLRKRLAYWSPFRALLGMIVVGTK